MPSLTRPAVAIGARESRRDFLKALALSLGVGELAACARVPDDPIVPATDDADAAQEDTPRLYATALTRDGYAQGVLVKTRFGHPVKIEGNPAHPASLGATDVFAQAAIWSLWDNGRARTVQRHGRLSTWSAFHDEIGARLAIDGTGLRVLAEPTTSPTLQRLRDALLRKFPAARWHSCSALPRDNVYEGARRAFGRALEPVFDFTRADVVLALDADFTTTLPGALRYAKDFSAQREAGAVRLYAAESTPTATGVLADHRFALRPGDIEQFALALCAALGDARANFSDERQQRRVEAIARDLRSKPSRSLVLCGDALPATTHHVVHAINSQLRNFGRTVQLREPILDAIDQLGSLANLCADIRDGKVAMLLILGGNPVYDTPADLQFAALLERVRWSAHLAAAEDETSLRCTWHLPCAHELESWGDLRAWDGSAAIQQPAIAPLYDSKTALELLALLLGEPRNGYELVRATWRKTFGADFDARWTAALRDGVVADSATTIIPLPALAQPATDAAPPADSADRLDVLFRPDPSLGDGRHAPNAWLQELPKPFTQLTWGNAALLAPATAQRLGLEDEDVIEIHSGDARIDAPVLRVPGHADNALTLPLGHGRTRAGAAASLRGFDAYRLRTRDAFWTASCTVRKTAFSVPLAVAQRRAILAPDGAVRVLHGNEPFAPTASAPSLFATAANNGDYAWAMTINLGACMGCNVCTIACQAENNIPSVGAEQVRHGRIMHWLRIDQYADTAPDPRLHAQPVPCMHCERAPCELVCPVGATVHDSEGLNVQVYNRCVGTRFCANNCPYKVRRFNFLQFSTPQVRDYANPDVTVRNRGVMEKCTYCIQRIETARIDADEHDRRLRDGEVVTACQAACPTNAITFGDQHDTGSAVARLKADARNYALLAELNTAPRTTYLAKRLNPNAEFPA